MPKRIGGKTLFRFLFRPLMRSRRFAAVDWVFAGKCCSPTKRAPCKSGNKRPGNGRKNGAVVDVSLVCGRSIYKIWGGI